MYVDSQIEFSDAQAVTATAISANVYDLFSMGLGGGATDVTPNTRLDIGQGTDHLYLVVNCATLATDSAGADATLTITLESADDAALTTNATVHYSSGAIAVGSGIAAGTNLVAIRLPSALYRRYLGVRYTVANGPLGAGAFDAIVTPTLQQNRIYKSGFTVQ